MQVLGHNPLAGFDLINEALGFLRPRPHTCARYCNEQKELSAVHETQIGKCKTPGSTHVRGNDIEGGERSKDQGQGGTDQA